MATIVSDLFTDADGTELSLHIPNTGGSWSEMGFQGHSTGGSTVDTVIVANKLKGGSTASSAAYRNATDPSTNEYDVAMDMVIDAANDLNYWSLMGRMTPTGTANAAIDRYVCYYRYGTVPTRKAWFLWKVVAGIRTDLASVAEDIGTGTKTGFKLEIRNAAKKVFLGATEKLTSADDAITQNGRAGIGAPLAAFANENRLDNYLVATVTGITTFRTLAGIAVGGAVLSRIATYPRVLAVAALGLAVLSRAATYPRTLAATAVGAAALSPAQLILRSLAAVALGAATLSRVRTVAQALSATAIGAATLTRISTYRRTLAATAIGVSALSGIATYARALAATAVGTTTLITSAILFSTLAVTATGLARLTRVRVALEFRIARLEARLSSLKKRMGLAGDD